MTTLALPRFLPREDIFAGVADTTKHKRPKALQRWLPRVLVADDDVMLRHILAYQLAPSDWEVVGCSDGVEALRLLREGGIDLLLIDLNLPHMNAFEVLAEMESLGGGPRIMVMSEQAQEDKVLRVFQLGADDFVQKPFNPRVMLSRIVRLLSRD